MICSGRSSESEKHKCHCFSIFAGTANKVAQILYLIWIQKSLCMFLYDIFLYWRKIEVKNKIYKTGENFTERTLLNILCSTLFQSQEWFLLWCPLSILTIIVLVIPVPVLIQEDLLPYCWWQNSVVNIKNKFSYPIIVGAYCWLSFPVIVVQYTFMRHRTLDPYLGTKINSYVKSLIERSLALYHVK